MQAAAQRRSHQALFTLAIAVFDSPFAPLPRAAFAVVLDAVVPLLTGVPQLLQARHR